MGGFVYNRNVMSQWTRRDLLKSGVVASAAAASQTAVSAQTAVPAAKENTERERLLLDFGWRFHFGHAWDESKDFDFGGNERLAQTFAKAGSFLPVCNADFDDGGWEKIDLPHDWAVSLPFVKAPPLVAHGSKPLGAPIPKPASDGTGGFSISRPATWAGGCRSNSTAFSGIPWWYSMATIWA